MDRLSELLNESGRGCKINGQVINNIMHADGSCLILPSPTGLQTLLDIICSSFAVLNTIVYNKSKSRYMCFIPKSVAELYVPALYIVFA